MMVLKALVALPVLWLLIFISRAQCDFVYYICGTNTTTYNPNSTYQANLNTLLSNLTSDDIAGKKLFDYAIAGKSAPDRAYGLFMCRGDVDKETCKYCVTTAASEIVRDCLREKFAYIWYDDCMLRYGNASFFSAMDVFPGVYAWNAAYVAEPDRFAEVVNNVMDNLATRASTDQSGDGGERMRGFVTNETNFRSNQTIYSAVQCTPNLSGADCNRCLLTAIRQIPDCCSGRPGGRVFLPSCTIRFEAYPFYRIAAEAPPPSPTPAIPPLPPPPPPPPALPTSPGGEGGISTQVILGIVVGVILSILLSALSFYLLRRRKKKNHDAREEATDGNEISEVESLQYDLSTIRAATNNFSAGNRLGTGGFGDVFKGILSNGQEIAVKRLSKSSGQGAKEFKTEVALVAKLHHKNLVRLLGFCLDQEEKILICELVPNKSLDYFLSDPEKRRLLDWSTRYKIINGIVSGILYLHEHSRLRVIHRDLKASNVLLDKDMNPKISDFGMAKIFSVDQTQADTSKVAGTFGYMPPEYVMHRKISVKTDIFSFGVLLLEIISGTMSASFHHSGGSENLINHAWKHWRDGTPLELVDPTLGDSVARDEVIRCINIGILCVQEDAAERPTMESVFDMLYSSYVTLPLPQRPAFLIRSRTKTMLMQQPLDRKLTPSSANEASISELYPR